MLTPQQIENLRAETSKNNPFLPHIFDAVGASQKFGLTEAIVQLAELLVECYDVMEDESHRP